MGIRMVRRLQTMLRHNGIKGLGKTSLEQRACYEVRGLPIARPSIIGLGFGLWGHKKEQDLWVGDLKIRTVHKETRLL